MIHGENAILSSETQAAPFPMQPHAIQMLMTTLSFVVVAALAIYCAVARLPAMPRWLTGYLVATAGWILTVGISDVAPLEWVDPLLRIKYLLIAMVSVGTLMLALEYTGIAHRVSAVAIAALFALPLVSQVVLWHPQWRALMLVGVDVDHPGATNLIEGTLHGPLYWVFVGYCWLLTAVGMALLGFGARRAGTLTRNQSVPMTLAITIPFVGSILVLAQLTPAGLNPMPISLALAAALFGYALLRRGLFKLTPIARSTVIDELSDGVLTLDADERIVDMNRALATITGADASTSIGRRPAELPALEAVVKPRCSGDTLTIDARHYDVRIVALRAPDGHRLGRSVLLSDQTERIMLLRERERLIDELSDALSRLRRLSGPIPMGSGSKPTRNDAGRQRSGMLSAQKGTLPQ